MKHVNYDGKQRTGYHEADYLRPERVRPITDRDLDNYRSIGYSKRSVENMMMNGSFSDE